MAGIFDDLTAARSNVMDRLSAGEPVDPSEREQLDQISSARQGEFRKGLRRAGYNTSATVDAFAGGLAEPFEPNFAERQFRKANNTIQNQPDTLRPEVESYQDVTDPSSAASYAASALGEGAASIGTMVAAGLAARFGLGGALRLGATGKNVAQYGGSMAAMLPQEGGETALSLRNNPEAMANTTPDERAALTLGRGTVNAALESIVPNVLLTNPIAGTAGRIAAGARPALANIGRKAAAGVVGEAGTEGAQELTGQYAENLAVPGTGYDMERAMEAAVRGAITGGVMGGAGGTIQAARSNIDAAAETAREKAGPAANDAWNATVETIDNLIRNPEEAGFDMTNTTMGALVEAQTRASELSREAADRAGPAAAQGMDTIAAMRARFDRAVAGQLTPENRQKYVELTQNFRLLQPTEYARLRDALDSGDTTQINEAIGDVAFQLKERVPRETMEGLKNITSWAKRFGSGVTRAAREGRKAAQAYTPEDITRFRAFLNDQYPNVLRTMDTTDASEPLARLLMSYRDNAQLLNAGLRPNDEAAMKYFEEQTGVPLTDVLSNARNWRNDSLTKDEKQKAYAESTGASQMVRVAEDAENLLLNDELQQQASRDGVDLSGPYNPDNVGVAPPAQGSIGDQLEKLGVRRDDNELMNEEDTRRTPFNSLGQVKRLLAADMLNGSLLRKKNPGFTLPATLRSKDKGVTAAFIGRLLGGRDNIRNPDGKWAAREVPVDADTIAMRTTEDGGYRQDFNSVDIAAQAGTPQERGGSRENFAGFVPEFDGTNRDLKIQGYRLLAAISSMHGNGIDIPRSEVDPALLEEFGLAPEGDDIHLDVEMDPNTLSNETVVQVGSKGKRVTIGDLNGSYREARSLQSQLELLQVLGDNPNGELQKLKNRTGRTGQTVKALSGGLYNFALRQERAKGRDLTELKAKEKRDTINSYAPAFADYLIERMGDSAAAQRNRRNLNRLNAGLREGIFTPEDVREYIEVLMRAYSQEERDAYDIELQELEDATTLEEMENVETADVDPDQLATEDEALAWADGLELEYDTTNDLVDLLYEFKHDDMQDYENQQALFDQEPSVQEPTIDDEFEANRRSPEGVETTLRKRGIEKQNDAAVRAGLTEATAPPRAERGETANARMIRERREAREIQDANEDIAREEGVERQAEVDQVMAEAADGDGTLRRAKGKVADREILTITTASGETLERPIAGEFTLFGETFVIHKSVSGKGWAVSHKDTAAGIGITGRRAISHAAEDAVNRLKELGRAKVAAAISQTRGSQPAQTTETKAKAETNAEKVRRVRAEQAAATPTEPAKTTAKRPTPQKREGETNAAMIRRVRGEREVGTAQPTGPQKRPIPKKRKGESNKEFLQRVRAEQQAAGERPAAPQRAGETANARMIRERREAEAAKTPAQQPKTQARPGETPNARMIRERREALAAGKPAPTDPFAVISAAQTEEALDAAVDTLLADKTISIDAAEEIRNVAEFRRIQIKEEGAERFAESVRKGTTGVGENSIRQRAVNNWAKKYLPDGAKVRVLEFDPTNADSKNFLEMRLGRDPDRVVGGTAVPVSVKDLFGDGSHAIFVQKPDSRRGFSQMSILAHEFGHIIQHEMHYADKSSWENLLTLYKEELQADFANTMSATRLFGARKDLVDAVEKGLMTSEQAMQEARRSMIEELSQMETAEDIQQSVYLVSFGEWFAENFARYAVGEPNVFAQADKGVRAHLDKIVAKLKQFYNEVVKKNFAPNETFKEYVESLAVRRNDIAADPDRAHNIRLRQIMDVSMVEQKQTAGLRAKAARESGAPETTGETPPPPPPPDEGTSETPPEKPKKSGETANARMIRERREAEANKGGTPPPPPPQGPADPPKAPPPPPDDEARAKFRATVKRLLGDRVTVEFDAETLPEGVAGEYQNRFGQDLEDTGKALKAVRETRREEIRALKKRRGATVEDINEGKVDPRTPEQIEASIRSLDAQEQEYLADLAVRGTIRVAAGMEAQAGLAEHEAFHAAFEIFFGDNNTSDRKAVTTAFTRGVLANRLQKYFAGNEEVLAVIDPTSPDFKAEEAAAYGFQVFLHEPEALQMGEKLTGIFNRFLQYLQRLVNYKTYEERARMVFNDLNSGRRSERGVSVLRERDSMEQSMLSRSQDFVRGVGTGFMHMYDTILTSAYDRLETSGNVAMAQIARLGYNETGQRGQGMIQLQRLATTKYSNQLKEALHALTNEELGQLNQAMILGDELTGKLGKAQESLRKILAEVHQYQVDAGTNIKFRENYYPMIWSPEKVAADAAGFVQMLTEKYPEEIAEMMRTPNEILDAITAYEERGHEFQGVFGKDGEPVADSSRRRTLDFISREDRLKYMEDDLVTTMAHYLNQSVRHAEYVRAYGQNGTRLKELMGEITGTYGGSQTDVAIAKDYVDGLMGNKEVGMSRELKDLYGAATVYQNVRLLPLSVFSSLVDPLGVAVRTQSMGAAFDTFAYSIRNMFTDFRNQNNWTRDQWEKYAEDMGTIDMSGTVKSIDKIYTGVTLRGKTREINDAFFKWNLLNGWVKNNHIMATKAAQLYLRRNAEGMFGDEMSAENLREAGVEANDIIYDEKLGRIRSTAPEILGYDNAEQMEQQATDDEIKAAREQAGRIQQAVHKIVRQSMIQPSSAEMPGWMSNPYLAPIAHLKTFVFGFNATILQRLMYEAQRGNYSPIYYATAYVPGMIAADFIKGFASNGGDEPEWKKNWGVSDYLTYGVERSGLMGTGQFFRDMNNDVTRGGGGWETLAGPTIEQSTDLMRAMNAPTSRPAQTWMMNAMPVNDLYDQWLME